MRHMMKIAALALALPLAAAAQSITNTAHDLASGSSATIRSTNQNQTCIFCHTPHFAPAQDLLWNRASTNTGFSGGPTTVRGTTLPATVNAESAACISCHDGSATLNVLNWAGLDSATGNENANPTMVGGVNTVRANYDIIGASGLNGNHPVSVAYPATDTMYLDVTNTGCTNASGLCSTGTGSSTNIMFYGTQAAPLVECGSCHEPHDRYGASANYFLRVTEAQSALCKACHIK